MKYSIYISSGKIVRLLDCDNIEQQLADGESYLEGWFLDNQYYVVQDEAVEMPPSPSEYCVFDYTNKQWIDPRTPETQWRVVRAERNKKLQASDWTDTASAPARLGQELYDQWQTYRQALRDVTEQSDPFNIIWPTPPQG
jgi:hypothetical protein